MNTDTVYTATAKADLDAALAPASSMEAFLAPRKPSTRARLEALEAERQDAQDEFELREEAQDAEFGCHQDVWW